MSVTILVAVCAALGALFEARAVRQFRRRRPVGGVFSALSGLVLILIAACVGLLSTGLRGYSRLTLERPVAQLSFHQTGLRQFDATLRLPDGTSIAYPLRGDQWQIDARLLKWKPLANVLGFDSVYRLERLGGRYDRIEDEQSAPRTVHALGPESPIDLWDYARSRHWPWVDAYYGSATFLPMAEGAQYDVKVTQSGLIARPANGAAEQAIGAWK